MSFDVNYSSSNLYAARIQPRGEIATFSGSKYIYWLDGLYTGRFQAHSALMQITIGVQGETVFQNQDSILFIEHFL